MPDTSIITETPLPEAGIRPRFDNSYARLPERLFARLPPTPVSAPRLLRLNTGLAEGLGLDPAWLTSPAGVAMLAGNLVPPGAEPIAQAYAGHQFGQFNPGLGDGRAILLGEVITPAGERRDIQLKGSGPTPFSRRGDGRAALGPVLREYLVSEAMAALGLPTTRALAAVLTGEKVVRETMLPGGVITRIAASHIRVGTFQFFAARGDGAGVRLLADHVIARHYPHAAETERPYRALLDAVIRAQAQLIARWLLIGFIHGVMNTDNMAVTGETIDYGPCAFLDAYEPDAVFSAIDRNGRYAFANQPGIAHWNLTRLAECLLPLLSESEEHALAEAEEALAAFAPAFTAAHESGLRQKLGLMTADDGDMELAADLLDRMAAHRADFTLTFRALSYAAATPDLAAEVRCLFTDPAAYDEWGTQWRRRLAQEPTDPRERQAAMLAVNPAFIPRNHRIEAVIRAAVDRDDFRPFEELLTVLSRPYEEQPAFAHYANTPEEHERVYQTFCGT